MPWARMSGWGRVRAGWGASGGRGGSRPGGKAAAGGEDDKGCPYRKFMMSGDLVKRVVEACRWGAVGKSKGFREGVLRLMASGRTRRWT